MTCCEDSVFRSKLDGACAVSPALQHCGRACIAGRALDDDFCTHPQCPRWTAQGRPSLSTEAMQQHKLGLAPGAARLPNKRAGTTRLSFITRRSPPADGRKAAELAVLYRTRITVEHQQARGVPRLGWRLGYEMLGQMVVVVAGQQGRTLESCRWTLWAKYENEKVDR